MSAPERIWIDPTFIDSPRMVPVLSGKLVTAKPGRKLITDVEYRRADLLPTDAEVMNHPTVKALVEKIEVLCQDEITRGDKNGQPIYAAAARACRDGILALAAIKEAKP